MPYLILFLTKINALITSSKTSASTHFLHNNVHFLVEPSTVKKAYPAIKMWFCCCEFWHIGRSQTNNSICFLLFFKVCHFSCSKNWCSYLCSPRWSGWSEAKNGDDSVCMFDGKRTEQNKIMQTYIITFCHVKHNECLAVYRVLKLSTRKIVCTSINYLLIMCL